MRDLKKDIVRRALLLDYYGGLLTEKQQQAYDLYFQEDFSLGEISDMQNVSRNAVFDLVSRTDEKLEKYEQALGLIAQDEKRSAIIDSIVKWSDCLSQDKKTELLELLKQLDNE